MRKYRKFTICHKINKLKKKMKKNIYRKLKNLFIILMAKPTNLDN